MLVLLVDQGQIPIIHQFVHLDLTGNHAMRLELAGTERVDYSLKVFLLVPKDGLVRRFAEHEPVRVEGNLEGEQVS